MNIKPAQLWFCAVAALLISVTGCTSSMTPGKLERVQAVSPPQEYARVGNVYLLRGWIGIFSAGIDNLTDKINAQGVRAQQYQDDQWSSLAETIGKKYQGVKDPEPLILVGHSYGADDVVRIARDLKKYNVTVDLVVTLDPVTPPAVTENVRVCYNLYQTNGAWDAMPFLRGVPLKPAEDAGAGTKLQNVNIRKDRTDLLEPGTDHFNIEKKGKIHDDIIVQVLAACPTRQQWAARSTRPPQAQPQAVAPVVQKAGHASGQQSASVTPSSN